MKKILITGSEGLIGHRLAQLLRAQGYDVVGVDLKPSTMGPSGIQGDIRDQGLMRTLAADAGGVIHLAAVSRVAVGEREPDLCRAVNIDGTRNVIDAARRGAENPWFMYASSREVYGHVDSFPVTEDFPLKPINVYGNTKATAEEDTHKFAAEGRVTSIVRFSNVYGSVDHDHHDRVIPAFARAAVTGQALRVDGSDNGFDFTHLEDTVRGLMSLIRTLDAEGKTIPPVHFVTGRETSLMKLARMAVDAAGSAAPITEAESRSYDVSRFCGSSARAEALLGWKAEIGLEEGLKRLVENFRSKTP